MEMGTVTNVMANLLYLVGDHFLLGIFGILLIGGICTFIIVKILISKTEWDYHSFPYLAGICYCIVAVFSMWFDGGYGVNGTKGWSGIISSIIDYASDALIFAPFILFLPIVLIRGIKKLINGIIKQFVNKEK